MSEVVSSTDSRWRKKPVEVQAWQYQGANDLDDSPLWVREYLCEMWDSDRRCKVKKRCRIDLSFWDCTPYLRIPTLEGVVAAVKGDWVIKDIADDPLFTGDIVITYTDSYGPQWLTVIVSEGDETYPMGLKTVPMDEPGQWRVKRLKEFKDVVAGEHWPAWGFSYGR